MSRDLFADVVMKAQGDGTFKALANVSVSVKLAGTNTNATIYQARTGTAQQTNPFTTDATGAVQFWAEHGEYDIKFHDINIPVRIGDSTVGWNAVGVAAEGFPTSSLAKDNGLVLSHLGADVLRQVAPLGQLAPWWRPSSSIPVPSGWAIADASVVTAANHDFGTGGSITLPDMRNAFVLGANAAIADGTVATAGSDVAGGAPGIGGVGGTNVRDLSHTHNVSAHTHSISTQAVMLTDAQGLHSHVYDTNLAVSGAVNVWVAATGNNLSAQRGFRSLFYSSTMQWNEVGASNAFLQTFTETTDSAGTHQHNVPAHTHGGATGSAGGGATDSKLSATQDIKPKYVGLLWIMKVKRS